jgi:hypothetical protein
VAYDYTLDLDGVLAPSNSPIVRNRGVIPVVLERGEKVPTKGQQRAIATIRTINPGWELASSTSAVNEKTRQFRLGGIFLKLNIRHSRIYAAAHQLPRETLNVPTSRSDTRKVNFYLQDEITPLTYDYDMDAFGVLLPARRNKAPDGKSINIVLEHGLEVPTREQREAIRNMQTLNPNWELSFFYGERVRPGKDIKRQMH